MNDVNNNANTNNNIDGGKIYNQKLCKNIQIITKIEEKWEIKNVTQPTDSNLNTHTNAKKNRDNA